VIFECYTATVLPGCIPEFSSRIEAALPGRKEVSPLGGAWRAEIGTLSQVVQLWPYHDLGELVEARQHLERAADWPVPVADVLEDERVDTWRSVPFLEPLEPGEYGKVYEMRTYRFRPGSMDRVLEIWAEALPIRVRMSPLVACMYSVSGELNRLRHVWAYDDLNERARIRQESLSLPSWPPMTREWRVHEESQILLPEAYSPLR
jgi:hypothetical protein